jgi:putative ABC transport system permease protein
MTPEKYVRASGDTPKYNTILLKTKDAAEQSAEAQGEMLRDIVNTEGVLSAVDTNQSRELISMMVNDMKSLIWIIVIVAALMAALVLYSLADINVRERTKEIAILKVLGFTKKETYAYITHENMLLTALGIVLGVPLGIMICKHIVGIVEWTDVLLLQKVSATSIVLAIAFTAVVMIITNLIMRFTINKIDPLISLNARE